MKTYIIFLTSYILFFSFYTITFAGVNTGSLVEIKETISENQGFSETMPVVLPIDNVSSTGALSNPLIYIKDFEYQGAFTFGKTSGVSGLAYSTGKMGIDTENQTLFISSHTYQDAIGEFKIPEFKKEEDYTKLNQAVQIQDFEYVFSKITNSESHNELGGMAVINDKLLFNSYTYYDAPADNTTTTSLIENKSDLKNTIIKGILKFKGRAHLVSWTSYIPLEWQSILGGDYISGSSNSIPINSRSSMGPSAFVFKSQDVIDNDNLDTIIDTTTLLDFDLGHILTDNSEGWSKYGVWDQYNENGDNTLWTQASGAEYGFIVPGTRTYATIGYSGMHNSGGGYKITQTNGNLCGGPCAKDPSDGYNYIWLWDILDLIKVKNGELKSYEVKPYQYGLFETPYETKKNGVHKNLIKGGGYDNLNNVLYLNLSSADQRSTYSHTPIVLAYKITDTKSPILSNGNPLSILPSGTKSIGITVDTNENATCKYGVNSGISYETMGTIFENTGGFNHSSQLTGLVDGATYTYYIKCIDEGLNINGEDYIVNFSISKKKTSIGGGGGGGGSRKPSKIKSNYEDKDGKKISELNKEGNKIEKIIVISEDTRLQHISNFMDNQLIIVNINGFQVYNIIGSENLNKNINSLSIKLNKKIKNKFIKIDVVNILNRIVLHISLYKSNDNTSDERKFYKEELRKVLRESIKKLKKLKRKDTIIHQTLTKRNKNNINK